MKLRLDLNYFIYESKFWLILSILSPLGIISSVYFGLYIPVIRFISGQIIKTIFKCSFSLAIIVVIISQFSILKSQNCSVYFFNCAFYHNWWLTY